MYRVLHIFRIITLFIALTISGVSKAQEIDFGTYSSSYTVSLTDLSPGSDLDYGIVIINEGAVNKDINEAKVLALEGVKYLDVIVDITADDYLLLNGNLSCVSDPNCRIPFTLQAAYANRGVNNVNQAIPMSVASNIASGQFAIKYRGNNPPGPPPTPVYSGYNPALYNETAYIYIYGSLNVGSINAGTYEGQITIMVSYD